MATEMKVFREVAKNHCLILWRINTTAAQNRAKRNQTGPKQDIRAKLSIKFNAVFICIRGTAERLSRGRIGGANSCGQLLACASWAAGA
jgi:hypothetical protein